MKLALQEKLEQSLDCLHYPQGHFHTVNTFQKSATATIYGQMFKPRAPEDTYGVAFSATQHVVLAT